MINPMFATLHRSVWTAIYYVPFFILCGVIFWFSSMSDPPVPEVFRFPNSDKFFHALAFAAVGASAALGSAVRKRFFGISTFLEAWILTGFYGFIDEIHQRFTPSRSSDVADWFADIIGAALGIMLFFVFYRWVSCRAQKKYHCVSFEKSAT